MECGLSTDIIFFINRGIVSHEIRACFRVLNHRAYCMELRMLRRAAFYYVSGPLNTATILCQAKYSIFAIYDV